MLVQRVGGKLTLCGRSPMEHVPVSTDIPKSIRTYYSQSVIAQRSGQILAGLFLLRTAIEQWARKFAPAPDYADRALEAYMTTLPDDFKARFPSLRQIYEKISLDIHKATGSSELYDAMLADFVEHFEARRLFKIADPK